MTDFSQNTNSALDEISFSASDVRNDVTGNWRISTIADNIDMVDYAIEYYNKYFESDDEIHAIVNFNYNTTTKISVIGNLRFFYISFHKNTHSPLPVFHPEESASGRHFYRKMTVRNMRKILPIFPNHLPAMFITGLLFDIPVCTHHRCRSSKCIVCKEIRAYFQATTALQTLPCLIL